jgi:hypothetical protein
MKRLIMVLAIAAAAHFAALGIQPASANDAHHPGAQATKGKKAKKPAARKAKSTKASMMKCPMMGGRMMRGGMMKCRASMHAMMSSSAHRDMHHGHAMMGNSTQCRVMTGR